MIHANVVVIGVVGFVAGIEAVVGGEAVVRRESAVLELWRGVGRDHRGELLIDQRRGNLVARRAAGDLNPVTRLAEAQSRILQGQGIARSIAGETDGGV